ncbi:MAG: condensation domain-containing protein, partial [Chloroflexi bacterium]|nr:condensation domain-containing protein [Chloroflexota bacterium]
MAVVVAEAMGKASSPPASPIQPVSRQDPLPLSFSQQRLWFLDQLEPDNVFNNIPAAVRLEGSLDVPALSRSLDEIVLRHEALRTSFANVEGKPHQVIHPPIDLHLSEIDLTSLPQAEREAEAARLAIEEARLPFDLANGPLLRASLLHLEDEVHVVLLTMHHIVSDGWSIGLLVKEMAVLYDAFGSGRPSPLPELPIQ